MRPSIGQAISQALGRTGTILFKPFQIGKWFLLGFCCFLANLGEGGGFNPAGQFQPSGGRGGSGGGFDRMVDWINAHLGLVLTISAIALLLLLAIAAVVTWLKSRGTFMFIDGLARNRSAVVEPWKEFRAHGNSYFVFSFLLGVVAMVAVLGLLALMIAIAWPDIRAHRFGSAAWTAVLGGGSALVLASIGLGIVGALLKDFIAPIMYVRDETVMVAWSTFRHELLPGNFWTIVLFYLMKIVLSIAVGIIAVMATCLTCCLAALPYIGTVILLPLFVFMRCYTLSFVEQFGPDWQIFVHDLRPANCPRCGYDLRGAPAAATNCPECGWPLDATPPQPPHAPPPVA